MNNKKYKINIIISINLIICFFLCFLFIYFQKYTCCIRHDFFLPYTLDMNTILNNGRVFSSFLNIGIVNSIPSILSINPNDFRSKFASFIFALPLFMMCIIWTKSFLLSKLEKESMLARKESIFLLIMSFLCIFVPINIVDIIDKTYLFNIKETTVFFEYSFGSIFYFTFYYILLKILLNKTEDIRKPILVLMSINSFLCGFWNEALNVAVFFSILFILVQMYIFDRKNLFNKKLIYIISSFLFGMILFYLSSDYVLNSTSVAGHSYNIKDALLLLKVNFINFNFLYIQYLFINNIFLYIVIFSFLLLLLLNRTNIVIHIMIVCFAILFGNILTNYIYIFFTNIDNHYLFQREAIIMFNNLVLYFIIILLSGGLYFNNRIKVAKLLVFIFYICVSLFYAKIFIDNYSKIMTNQYNIKSSLYKLDEINLIYSILGESAILPLSFFYNDVNGCTRIFIFQDKIENYSKSESADFFKNRYFNSFYTGYAEYFNKQYKHKQIGFYVTDDIIALSEFEKRLKLINENYIKNIKLESKKIKFSNLNQYKNIYLTMNNINQINENKENKLIILKAKAYIEYKNYNYDAARILYEKYLKESPNDFDALQNLGEIYLKTRSIEKAEQIFTRLYNLDKKNVSFLYKLLQINYVYKKDYQKSKEILEMINIATKDINIYNLIYWGNINIIQTEIEEDTDSSNK